LRKLHPGRNEIFAKNIPSLLYDDLIQLKSKIHPVLNSAEVFLTSTGQCNLVKREAILLAIYNISYRYYLGTMKPSEFMEKCYF
jgi:hypothetical protein